MSISDMMSGLMLVFLFIAIGFMIEVQSQKDALVDVAQSYKDTKANLNEALFDEFEDDLEKWNASITKDNSVVFNSPEVLFEVSESKIQEQFKTILNQFFPRFIKILSSNPYKDEIIDVRVEGHTSNTWANTTDKNKIYLNNMQLSQNRAYEVLSYCYSLDDESVQQNRAWLEKYFRANGMAYSKPKVNGHSRRVEFTIQLKSEDRIDKILK